MNLSQGQFRLLHLEDDVVDAELVLKNLRNNGLGCEAVRADTAAAFEGELERGEFDLILADHSLPGFDGLAALALARERRPEVPFILLSATLAEDIAVESLKGGATDFVLKQKLERLAPAVRRALREVRERDQRRLAEQELHLWASLFEHAVWGIAVCSIDDLRIEKVNPGFARMHGYTVEELPGRALARILAPAEGEAAPFDRLPSSNAEGGHRFESIHLRKDGTTFPVLVDATRLTDPRSGRVYLGLHVNDLTERKRLEEQLVQAQKMEAVGRLAGGVAHDFNNILTAIIGYSDLILADGGIEGQTLQDVTDIKSSAERAAALTRQLLAFSRRQILQPRMIDLNEAVRDVEKMLRRVVPETITVRCALSEDLFAIKADPSQIEQVVLNLAVNAKDAMESGGVLEIRTDNEGVVADVSYGRFVVPAGDYAALSVCDTGTGMTEEVIDKLFEPFFTTKAAGKGTGLGLAMVYGIVKQSGGYILVESAPGEGTTFRLLFPKTEGERESTRRSASAAALPKGNERVLVVEDDNVVREFIRRVLASQGYQVATASNGREALSRIGSDETLPDLVLTDVVMPELDGKGLAKELSNRHPHLRLLYMSGYSSYRILGEALERGALLLKKPFTSVALLTRVREALDVGPGIH